MIFCLNRLLYHNTILNDFEIPGLRGTHIFTIERKLIGSYSNKKITDRMFFLFRKFKMYTKIFIPTYYGGQLNKKRGISTKYSKAIPR